MNGKGFRRASSPCAMARFSRIIWSSCPWNQTLSKKACVLVTAVMISGLQSVNQGCSVLLCCHCFQAVAVIRATQYVSVLVWVHVYVYSRLWNNADFPQLKFRTIEILLNAFNSTYVSFCFTLGISQKCSIVLSHIMYMQQSLNNNTNMSMINMVNVNVCVCSS